MVALFWRTLSIAHFCLFSALPVAADDVSTVTAPPPVDSAYTLETATDSNVFIVRSRQDYPLFDLATERFIGACSKATKESWADPQGQAKSGPHFIVLPSWNHRGVSIIDVKRLLSYDLNLSSRSVHDFEISPDRRLLAVTVKDVVIYDVSTLDRVAVLPCPNKGSDATSVAFTPDSGYLIVTNGGHPTDKGQGGSPLTITRWRLSDFSAERTEDCPAAPKQTVVTPDGRTVILNPEVLLLLDRESLQSKEKRQSAVGNIGRISFSPNGKYLVVPGAHEDSAIEIIAIQTWKSVALLKTKGVVGSARFMSDDEVVFLHVEDVSDPLFRKQIKRWAWR
jgi:hypothetical protein